MEIIVLTLCGWIAAALLIAQAGKKLKKKFLPSFLFSLFLSPIAGLIYLNSGNSSSNKKSKRGGPWSAWISKAEESYSNEDFQLARECYHNALKELQDPNGQAKYYYNKYILSKISEVNYALTLLENKKDKQVPFDINSQNTYLKKAMDNLSEEESSSKTG